MAELVESSGGDWNPGNKILVEVENVFEDGVVVSFIDANGTEYRGALLSQPSVDLSQAEAIVKVACEGLANPLTFLHDHPYPNLRMYANHLSTKIPSDVLLQWNRLPSCTVSPLPDNLNSIATRQKKNDTQLKEYARLNGALPGPQLSMPQIRSATVLAEPETEPRYLFPNHGLPGLSGNRKAKDVAQWRLRGLVDNFNTSDREFFKKGSVRNRVVTSRKRNRDSEKVSSSERPPVQKKYKLRKSNDEQTICPSSSIGPCIRRIEDGTNAPETNQLEVSSRNSECDDLLMNECQNSSGKSKTKKLSVKNFSISLARIPIKILEQTPSDYSCNGSSPPSSPMILIID